VKGLLQKDEGGFFRFGEEKLIFHNAACDNKEFHWIYSVFILPWGYSGALAFTQILLIVISKYLSTPSECGNDNKESIDGTFWLCYQNLMPEDQGPIFGDALYPVIAR
jgi:hypothetical protein